MRARLAGFARRRARGGRIPPAARDAENARRARSSRTSRSGMARNSRGRSLAQDAVRGAPQEQRRQLDAVQAVPELRIVHVGRPGEARMGFPVARRGEQLLFGQGLVVALAGLGIETGERVELGGHQRQMSTMSRVSRSPTLTPTAFASTSCDSRAVFFAAISAAIQPPRPTPTTSMSSRSSWSSRSR